MRGLILLIALVIFAVPAVAQTPKQQGSWLYAGGVGEIRKMEQSVSSVVAEMNFMIRPIARPRLESEARPWKRLGIEFDGEQVTVSIDGQPTTSPLGQKVPFKGGEEEATVLRTLKGDVLIETIQSKRGARTNEYHSVADGLKVVSTIFSPRLPTPLRFTYSYR